MSLEKLRENITIPTESLSLGVTGAGCAAIRRKEPAMVFVNSMSGLFHKDVSLAFIHRIDDLRKVPAAVRFLSCEPLIGSLRKLNLKGIDWVIVGGESGARPRPMKPEWAVEIRDQCRKHDVAFFFKQWGGRNKKAAGRELEGTFHDTFPKAKKRRPAKIS